MVGCERVAELGDILAKSDHAVALLVDNWSDHKIFSISKNENSIAMTLQNNEKVTTALPVYGRRTEAISCTSSSCQLTL